MSGLRLPARESERGTLNLKRETTTETDMGVRFPNRSRPALICTSMHRDAQGLAAISVDGFWGREYRATRLSREALKTSQLS
jgi:hypothetical protein